MAGKSSFKNLKPKNATNRKSKPSGIAEKVIRLLEIYTLIARKQYPSANALQERYNVSKRTVHRYLEIINMIDSIELDKERNGYKFILGDRLKKLMLSKEDFLLLLTFSETINHLGVPLRENFRKFIDRMVNVSTTQFQKNNVPIVIKIPDAIENDRFNDFFRIISNCINERRSIDIVYKALYSGETAERRVDPYGLVFYEGTWVLIGYYHLRETIRKFALDQIINLRETRLYFKENSDFRIEDYISHSWGIQDAEEVTIKLKFSSKIADYITRKNKWHPSEKRTILPTGDIELSFTVAGIGEIKRWIYGWLPDVEVIEPEWFREQVKKELSESAGNHV